MGGHAEQATALASKVPQAALWSLSAKTVRYRRSQLRRFADWCRIHGRDSVPASAETVGLFLTDMADRYRPSTVGVFLSTIAFAHRVASEPFDPLLFAPLMRGIRRTHGTARRQAAAITVGELRAIVDTLPNTADGLRDRAVLAVGFAGALRRSELIGLDIGGTQASVGSVEIDRQGAHILLRRSKPDPFGKGLARWLPRGGSPCPVEALERWLAHARIASGPVFRRVRVGGAVGTTRLDVDSVSFIVRRAVYRHALLSGAREHEARLRMQEVTSHSLRVGFVTSALMAGVSCEDIAQHIGWRTTELVFRYARPTDPFRDNPAQIVFAL
jgi:integrase